MTLSKAERKAFVDAASPLIALREQLELLAEQQKPISDELSMRLLAISQNVNLVCREIFRANNKIRALRFRDRIFVMVIEPGTTTEYKHVVVVPENQIVAVEED